jgi:hypothetical protein
MKIFTKFRFENLKGEGRLGDPGRVGILETEVI